jgi:ankyrin repeat protein
MKRGKKGAKKKKNNTRVVAKRWKEEDDRKKREKEEDERKQKLIEKERQQEQLNKELLYACRNKTIAEVKALLERGANLLHCDENELNCLHLACCNEDYEAAEKIVVYLIKKQTEAVVTALVLKQEVFLQIFDHKHWTALHFAARYSIAKICEMLIDTGYDVNGRTDTLFTPLILCCVRSDRDSVKVAKLLIESGADLATKDEIGNTVLHVACFQGAVDVVQLLIDAKADVNAQNHNGKTPLMNSVKNIEVAKLLIENGADLANKDNDGNTALYLACYESAVDVVKLLIDAKADVNAQNNDGMTPLINHLEKK